MKNINEITKIIVIDFDNTLINTSEAREGKLLYKEATGKIFPYRGWWGRKESLDLNIFPNTPFPDMEQLYHENINNSNVFVSLLTGRIVKLSKEVNAILDHHAFNFDEVALTGDKKYSGKGVNDTLSFKLSYLGSLQKTFPNLMEIDIFDDRESHKSTFIQWAKQQPISVNYYQVKR